MEVGVGGFGIVVIAGLAATLGVIQVLIASPVLASVEDGNLDGELVHNDQHEPGQLSEIEREDDQY